MSPRIAANQREQYLQTRRDQILDAAVGVFAKNGFAGANMEQIASAANVAKGTIYLYFKSKEEIFKAILNERSFVPHLADLVTEDLPLEIMLRQIAEGYFQYMESHLSIVRMALADSTHFPEHAQLVYTEIVLKGNQMLANFLKKQSQAGLIRQLENPFLTARAFIGMLMTHILLQEVLGGKNIRPIAKEAWMQECIQIFMVSISLPTS
jgi:AcrR family transcriptional regulator